MGVEAEGAGVAGAGAAAGGADTGVVATGAGVGAGVAGGGTDVAVGVGVGTAGAGVDGAASAGVGATAVGAGAGVVTGELVSRAFGVVRRVSRLDSSSRVRLVDVDDGAGVEAAGAAGGAVGGAADGATGAGTGAGSTAGVSIAVGGGTGRPAGTVVVAAGAAAADRGSGPLGRVAQIAMPMKMIPAVAATATHMILLSLSTPARVLVATRESSRSWRRRRAERRSRGSVTDTSPGDDTAQDVTLLVALSALAAGVGGAAARAVTTGCLLGRAGDAFTAWPDLPAASSAVVDGRDEDGCEPAAGMPTSVSSPASCLSMSAMMVTRSSRRGASSPRIAVIKLSRSVEADSTSPGPLARVPSPAPASPPPTDRKCPREVATVSLLPVHEPSTRRSARVDKARFTAP